MLVASWLIEYNVLFQFGPKYWLLWNPQSYSKSNKKLSKEHFSQWIYPSSSIVSNPSSHAWHQVIYSLFSHAVHLRQIIYVKKCQWFLKLKKHYIYVAKYLLESKHSLPTSVAIEQGICWFKIKGKVPKAAFIQFPSCRWETLLLIISLHSVDSFSSTIFKMATILLT